MTTKVDLINAFHERNFAFLTDLVRENVELEPEVRELLADILLRIIKGELKLPPHRPAREANKKRRRTIAQRVLELQSEDWPTEAAVIRAATEFDRSERWVWDVLREYRREQDRFTETFEKLLSIQEKHGLQLEEFEALLRRQIDRLVDEQLNSKYKGKKSGVK